MSKLQFNPKLSICDYFDKLISLIDTHTEEQLDKYSQSGCTTNSMGENQLKEFELRKKQKQEKNYKFFKFEKRNVKQIIEEDNQIFYDLTKQQTLKIEWDSVEIRDYLNTNRDELICEVRKYEEEALSRYEEIKDDVLKSLQMIENRDEQIDEFRKRLFENRHIGVFEIDKFDDFSIHTDYALPLRLYLVVLDFYVNQSGQEFLSSMGYSINGFLYFGQQLKVEIKDSIKIVPTLILDKVSLIE